MQNPIRLLGHVVARVLACPPLVVGVLCTTAVFAWMCTDSLKKSDAYGRDRTTHPPAGETSHKRSNNRARTADPAQALTRAFTLEKGIERANLIRELLFEWAQRDAEAALDWVSSLEDPAARRSARSTVCLAVAEKDPRRAVSLALAQGADEDDDRGLLESLTMQWCEKEPETVLGWAREQPSGEWRDRLLARTSFVLSKSDPAEAARVVSGLAPGSLQDEAAMAVLHQWALKDSAAALQWAEAFYEPSLRERALAEISNLRNPRMASHEAE